MLPSFPRFKKLELSDQEDIETITSQYLPYSDFNFPSMWSWDVKDNIMVSELNNNLVVILTDHFSDIPFYSFLGDREVNKTLRRLFDFSAQTKTSRPKLRFIPEASLQGIDLDRFMIEIDLDNCDYIYDLNQLATYPGNKYSDKRRKIHGFLRSHNNPVVEILDLSNLEHRSKTLHLNDIWAQNKTKRDEGLDLKKEFVAFERFLKAGFKDTFCVGVSVDGTLIGYSIFTFLPGNYAICHFSKADTSFEGVHEYLMEESAAILLDHHCVYLNYQEDLGLSGLRFWKNSFKPVSFLRKYHISEL